MMSMKAMTAKAATPVKVAAMKAMKAKAAAPVKAAAMKAMKAKAAAPVKAAAMKAMKAKAAAPVKGAAMKAMKAKAAEPVKAPAMKWFVPPKMHVAVMLGHGKGGMANGHPIPLVVKDPPPFVIEKMIAARLAELAKAKGAE